MPTNRKRRSGRPSREELEQRLVNVVRERRVADLRHIRERLWPDLGPNAVLKYLRRMTQPNGLLRKFNHGFYALRTDVSADLVLFLIFPLSDADRASDEDLAMGRFGRRL